MMPWSEALVLGGDCGASPGADVVELWLDRPVSKKGMKCCCPGLLGWYAVFDGEKGGVWYEGIYTSILLLLYRVYSGSKWGL